MEIIFTPPPLVLWISILIFLATVVVLFFIKNNNRLKLVALMTVSILICILLFTFYRESHLRVSDPGIYTDIHGEFLLAWEDISQTIVLPSLIRSEYNPVACIRGTSRGDTRLGWFQLVNNQTARVVAETTGRCLVVRAGNALCLFAPVEFDEFLQAVDKHLEIQCANPATE